MLITELQEMTDCDCDCIVPDAIVLVQNHLTEKKAVKS